MSKCTIHVCPRRALAIKPRQYVQSPMMCTRDVEEVLSMVKATAIHCPARPRTNHGSFRGSGFSLHSLCLLRQLACSTSHGLVAATVGPPMAYYISVHLPLPWLTLPRRNNDDSIIHCTTHRDAHAQSAIPLYLVLSARRLNCRLPPSLSLPVLLLCCPRAACPGQLEPRAIKAYRIVD